MIKKSLFKKITALALATCLATSPAVIYAADDAEAVFVEEQETVESDEASSDEGYAEEVFTEDVNEEEKIEETVTEEPEFVGDDVSVEENNEPLFVEESEVTEDSATEDVAAAEEAAYAEEPFGVDADTMAQLVAGSDVVEDEYTNQETAATDEVNYAAPSTYTFTKYDEGIALSDIFGSGFESYTLDSFTKTTPDDFIGLSDNSNSLSWATTATAVPTFSKSTASEKFVFTYHATSTPATSLTWTITFTGNYNKAVRGNTYYPSVASALAVGGEITLLANDTLSEPVALGANTVLNLAGHTITAATGSTVSSLISLGDNDLEINGTTSGSAITNTTGMAILAGGTGALTVKSGTITGAGEAAIYASGSGNVSISGGTITGSSGYGVYFGSTGDLSISAGTITGYTSSNAGVYVASGADEVTLTDGTYKGKYGIEVAAAPRVMKAKTAILTGNTVKLPDNTLWVYDSSTDTNTLTPAATALSTNDNYVKLYADTVFSPTVSIAYTGTGTGAEVTLDLNGFDLTNGSNYVTPLIEVGNGVTLDVIDSKGSGTIANSMTNGSAIAFKSGATSPKLVLGSSTSKAFTISADGDAIIDAGATTSELTVDTNATVKSTSGNAISAVDKVTVKDGTITGGTNGVAMPRAGALDVKGGTITPGSGAAVLIGAKSAEITGVSTINGGTLNGTTKLSVVGASLGNAASVKVYNTGVVEASNVEITSGCFWKKSSLDSFNTLIGVGSYDAAAQKDGDTITLAGKITGAPALTISKKVTLDLNGQSFTTASAATSSIDVTGGNLTIIDSVGGGKIENTNDSGYGIYVTGDTASTLVLGETSKSNFTVTSKSDAVMEGVGSTSESTTITINGGTYESTTSNYAIYKAGKGVLTINDGKFDGTVADVYAQDGTINIKGGTYENALNARLNTEEANTSLTAKVYNNAVDISDNAVVRVDGDYLWVTDSSNVSTLTSLDKVFATAGTVKLPRDIHTHFDVSAKVTLDLNGHSITANGAEDYMIGIKKGGDLTIINSDKSTTVPTIGSGGTGKVAASAIKMLTTGSSATPKLTVGSASDTTLNNLAISGGTNGIWDYVACETTVNGGSVEGATAIKHDAGTLTVVDGMIDGGTEGVSFKTATAATATLKGGVYSGTNFAVVGTNEKLKLKISGGAYSEVNVGSPVEEFMTGGVYTVKPSTGYLASGYKVVENTDSGASVYKWRVSSTSARSSLTLAYTPTAASSAPTSDPTDLDDLEVGTSVIVKASNASTGYTFDGWYNGKTRLATTQSYTYTTTAEDVTLTAVYTKDLTVTIKNDEVVSGTAYAPKNTVDSLTVTGLEGTDTAATVLDVSAMKLTSTYNKDTSAIGTTYPITQTGLKIKTSTTTVPKYNIKTTTNGTLTVIAGTGPEEFIAEVNKLPAATAVTVDNLAATKTAVEKAKADYAKLSTASKNLDTVKAAKTKLDAVDAAVTKLDTDKKAADAADKLIQALPAAKDATSADREKLDAATKAFNALTADQKKLVPTADQTKLADVTKAVEAAEKADQEAAAAVKKLIDALPTVAEATADDREALDAAQKAYDALTPAQKKLLPGAQATLDALDEVITAAENDKKAADAVTAKINALPDPEDATKEDREKVDAAKDALAALTPAQQKLVPQTAKDRLEAVDEAVKAKEGGDDQKAADACMEKIEAIKKQPAGKGKAATEEARAAFDQLTDAQKALLPKSAESLLTAAEEAYTKDRTFQCGDNWYKVLPSGNVSYNRPADSDCTSATVPNQIKKNGYMYKVVKVSIGAFKNCTSLEWVVINKNIQIIGEYAFKNTPSLTKIKVLTRQLKAGKVVKAFAAGGKSNGAKLTVKTPSTYVAPYDSLFKGEGLLNQKATVKAA